MDGMKIIVWGGGYKINFPVKTIDIIVQHLAPSPKLSKILKEAHDLILEQLPHSLYPENERMMKLRIRPLNIDFDPLNKILSLTENEAEEWTHILYDEFGEVATIKLEIAYWYWPLTEFETAPSN